jgi:hypothetical protein
MECPSCHHWNETGARFCEECGFNLISMDGGNGHSGEVPPSPDSPKAYSAPAELPELTLVPDPPAQTLVAPEKVAASADYGAAHFILNETGSLFKLSPLTVIGRADQTAQIDFEGYPNGNYISHRHAQITDKDGTYYVEDLGSANHTYVNDKRLSPGQSEPLRDGDRLRLGKIELLFHEK